MRKLATLLTALALFGTALGCKHTDSGDCGCADGSAGWSTHAAPSLTPAPTVKPESLQMPKGDSK